MPDVAHLDRDGDDILDEEGKCVKIPGVTEYHDSPIPDTNGDEGTDDLDSCITVAGVLQYNGCPPPAAALDTPDRAMRDSICRKVKEASRNIFFVTGSYPIDSLSYSEIDNIVRVPNENPHLNLIVEGHTDD